MHYLIPCRIGLNNLFGVSSLTQDVDTVLVYTVGNLDPKLGSLNPTKQKMGLIQLLSHDGVASLARSWTHGALHSSCVEGHHMVPR